AGAAHVLDLPNHGSQRAVDRLAAGQEPEDVPGPLSVGGALRPNRLLLLQLAACAWSRPAAQAPIWPARQHGQRGTSHRERPRLLALSSRVLPVGLGVFHVESRDLAADERPV